ncbi:serine protease, partial [bacterium]|nr:serine protease [bacterium]
MLPLEEKQNYVRRLFKLLVLCFTFLGTTSFAGGLTGLDANLTVSLKSYECSNPAKTIDGSGYPFAYKGKTYILTSDHVVFQSHSNRYCFQVTTTNGYKYSAKFVASEWGKGLAILKPDNFPPQKIVDIRHWESTFPKPELKIFSVGYTNRTLKILQKNHYSISFNNSDRNIFAAVDNIILANINLSEPGMSGGPVFSEEHRHFIGIMTHQLYNWFTDSSGIEQPDLHTTILPLSEIRPWVIDTLDDIENFVPNFVADPKSAHPGRESILVAGLSFSASSHNLDDLVSKCGMSKLRTYPGNRLDRRFHFQSSSEPSQMFLPQMFLSQMAPSSGGDPVGISTISHSQRHFIKLKVELDRTNTKTKWFLPESNWWIVY